MSFEKKERSNVGGLWAGVTESGNKKVTVSIDAQYLSTLKPNAKGNIRIVAYKNSYKKPGDKSPDYNIPLPKPDGFQNQGQQQAAPRAYEKPQAHKYNQDFDDINF